MKTNAFDFSVDTFFTPNYKHVSKIVREVGLIQVPFAVVLIICPLCHNDARIPQFRNCNFFQWVNNFQFLQSVLHYLDSQSGRSYLMPCMHPKSRLSHFSHFGTHLVVCLLLYLAQHIEHPILRIPNFNFPNFDIAKWFFFSSFLF